jgi:hypothetical protein
MLSTRSTPFAKLVGGIKPMLASDRAKAQAMRVKVILGFNITGVKLHIVGVRCKRGRTMG